MPLKTFEIELISDLYTREQLIDIVVNKYTDELTEEFGEDRVYDICNGVVNHLLASRYEDGRPYFIEVKPKYTDPYVCFEDVRYFPIVDDMYRVVSLPKRTWYYGEIIAHIRRTLGISSVGACTVMFNEWIGKEYYTLWKKITRFVCEGFWDRIAVGFYRFKKLRNPTQFGMPVEMKVSVDIKPEFVNKMGMLSWTARIGGKYKDNWEIKVYHTVSAKDAEDEEKMDKFFRKLMDGVLEVIDYPTLKEWEGASSNWKDRANAPVFQVLDADKEDMVDGYWEKISDSSERESGILGE